ncbi:hypothetical protein ABZ746_25990 [Streptomyces sp. NPDC020096]
MSQDDIYLLEIFLWVVSIMLVRGNDVRTWQLIVIGLAGFYLAMTPIGNAVVAVVNMLVMMGSS